MKTGKFRIPGKKALLKNSDPPEVVVMDVTETANDLYLSVAVELGQPKERISVEMVFRGLYHLAALY